MRSSGPSTSINSLDWFSSLVYLNSSEVYLFFSRPASNFLHRQHAQPFSRSQCTFPLKPAITLITHTTRPAKLRQQPLFPFISSRPLCKPPPSHSLPPPGSSPVHLNHQVAPSSHACRCPVHDFLFSSTGLGFSQPPSFCCSICRFVESNLFVLCDSLNGFDFHF